MPRISEAAGKTPFKVRGRGVFASSIAFGIGILTACWVATPQAGGLDPAKPHFASSDRSLSAADTVGLPAPSHQDIERARELATGKDDLPALAALREIERWSKSPDPEVSAAAVTAQTRRFAEAGSALRRLGATVFSKGSQIVEVILNGCSIDDDDLRWLRGWPELTDLSLERTSVTDTGVGHLQGLPKLEWLNLYRTRIGNHGLRHLARLPRLRHLPIGETRVTDEGLSELAKLEHLEYLGLRGNEISDAGLEALRRFPSLIGLHLGGTRLTDAGVSNLTCLTGLRRLWLTETRLSDQAIPGLASLTNLKELHLEGTAVTEGGRMQLRAILPGIEIEP